MGQKDLAAKQFERSPEVFADIINALIFEGDRVVFPKDLQPAPTESLYPAEDGMLRNQYSDVSKYEIRDGRIAMQYTLENQSRPDYKILLRKAGYEGAIYRQQYDGKDTYPAITLVLYWGDAAWNTSSDLHKFFRKKRIHGMARKYIDNVRLHMYSMRCLPQETRQRFRSDMRVVVDYLAEGEKYIPTDQEIVDVEATMRMLYALTGETNFIDNMEELQKRREEGGEITMGYAVSMYVERGRQEGRQEGRQRGIQEEKIRNATAFVKESVLQKQSKEYIKGMLQTCFQLKEEEADSLYREGYEREHEAELSTLT
ncbi:MAG: Rpn family recombination-promoting nuclease/putative transposase [Lachnospiraceae bacterium]|nr:Rpn family recombination-promoting nuclease/putative transposase [Lachnospiraceae bacterium]